MDQDGEWVPARRRWQLGAGPDLPLQDTVDASIERRNVIGDVIGNVIREATSFRNYVAGMLFLPDMERVAIDHDDVHVIWGVDDLWSDLESVAEQADI